MNTNPKLNTKYATMIGSTIGKRAGPIQSAASIPAVTIAITNRASALVSSRCAVGAPNLIGEACNLSLISAMARTQTFRPLTIRCPTTHPLCLLQPPITVAKRTASLHLLSRPRRARRSSDWSPAKAVTFIVTLAAHRSVTLAAEEAGMSRKSAYVLKDRDPAFAAAWDAALRTRKSRRQGDKVEEVEGPPVSSSQGNTLHASLRADRRADRLFVALGRSRRRPPGGRKLSLHGDK